MKLKERAAKLKTDIPAIFLALKSPEAPKSAKILGAVFICYALSPIDLIPDFIPFLGYLDDIIILPALATACIKLLPIPLLQKCRRQANADMLSGAKRWYFAIPTALIWAFVIAKLVGLLWGKR